ncbi:hypothetical protein ACS0TY_007694 [Phlomoides rotata]
MDSTSEKREISKTKPTLKTAPVWAVQCRQCGKWRVISSQKRYEQIRRHIVEKPFTCNFKENVSCKDPPDLHPPTARTRLLWGMDKPNLPTSLPGFTRKLSLRHSLSRLEVYYETPNGKILRRPPDVARYLSRHPQFRGTLSPADFDFKPPKLIAKKNTVNK